MKPEMNLDTMKEQLGENLIEGPIQAALEGLHETNPEAFKEALLSMGEVAQDFIHGEAEIDFQALRKSLTIKQKFGLMVQYWLVGAVQGFEVPEEKEGKHSQAFEDEVERLKNEENSAAIIVDDKNILWPKAGNFLEKIELEMGKLSQVVKTGEEGESEIRFVTGVTLIRPRGNKFFKAAVALKGLGIEVKRFTPLETIPEPQENQIFIVNTPPEGLPKKEGKVNVETLQGFKRLKETGKNQWFSPDVLAGVLKLEGLTTEEALEKAGLPQNSPIKSDLDTLTA